MVLLDTGTQFYPYAFKSAQKPEHKNSLYFFKKESEKNKYLRLLIPANLLSY